jgi:hypothetical protein
LHKLNEFSLFLQQYDTAEKIAVVVPMVTFDDPVIPRLPIVESFAESLIFLLQQVNYDVIVMAPQHAEQGVEHKWFLKPTAENIVCMMESLMNRLPSSKDSCVALFFLTRGFSGYFDRDGCKRLFACTQDTDIASMSQRHVIEPARLAEELRGRVGFEPFVFCDTWPLEQCPHSEERIEWRKGKSSASVENPTAPPSKAFFSLHAPPEDGGNEITCYYPPYAGGIATYYMCRALEGRACPPQSLSLTVSTLIWYFSERLQKRGCRVLHNGTAPKAPSTLLSYANFGRLHQTWEALQKSLREADRADLGARTRISVRLWTRIDPPSFRPGVSSWLPNHAYWCQMLRRELDALLHPSQCLPHKDSERHAAPPGSLRCVHVRESQEELRIKYDDLSDVVVDDKKCRHFEKDFDQLRARLKAIQKDEGRGYVPNDETDTEMPRQSPPQAKVKTISSTLQAPLGVSYELCSGFVGLFFVGQLIPVQQDFAIQYFLSGALPETPPRTASVSLRKTPQGVWGCVDVVFEGSRCDFRKLQRICCEQSLRFKHNVDIESVQIDTFSEREHRAATSIQRVYRGTTACKRYRARRKINRMEKVHREEIEEKQRLLWEAILTQWSCESMELLLAYEESRRQLLESREQDSRHSQAKYAAEILLGLFGAKLSRIECDEQWCFLPLSECALRERTAFTGIQCGAVLGLMERLERGLLWDRYLIEIDFYQSMLRLRNAFRDESPLPCSLPPFAMAPPLPPCSAPEFIRRVVRQGSVYL